MYARDNGFSISKPDMMKIFDAFCSAAHQAIIEGEEVRIKNVGVLYRKIYSARQIHDFAGNQMYSPAHYKPAFRASEELRKEIGKIEVTEEDIKKE